jgi:hypothetical protein
MGFVFGLKEAFGFCFVTGAQALLESGFPILDVPDAAGAPENPKFVSHVVARG